MLRSGGSRKERDEALAAHLRVGEQVEHALLALDGADRARVLGPVDLALVVGRGGDVAELGRAAGADVGGQVGAGAVEQGEVLGGVHGDRGERLARLVDVAADLEQVAHDDRDAEAVADVAAPAEGERDGEAGVVDPVEQAPQAVAHPEHPAAGPLGQVHEPLEARDRVVVVAHEHGLVAGPGALRAADDEARRPVEREQPRGHLVAAGEPDEPLVGRHELRHVAGERAPAGLEVGPVGAAVLEVPGPVGRPHRVEARLPLRRPA